MKKITLLIFVAVFVATTFAQQTITIGTETRTDYSPLGGVRGYERHAVLYLNSDLGNANGTPIASADITKVAFRLTSFETVANSNRKIKIYVKEISETELTNAMFNDWAALVASSTLVYDRQGTSISLVANQWNNFVFSAPFHYNGGNLLIFTDTEGNTLTGGNYTNAQYTGILRRSWRAKKNDSPPLSNDNSNAISSESGVTWNVWNIQITLNNIAACTPPTALTVNNTTNSSAELSWTETGAATSWVVEYQKTSQTTYYWTPVSAATNPFLLQNLAQGVYNVRVKAVCAAGAVESEWSNIITFKVGCGALSVPYEETFENGVFNFDCWRRFYGNSMTTVTPELYATDIGSTNSPSGAYYLRFSSADNYTAVLPEFAVDVNTLRISFWTLREGTYSGTFQVGYLNNINDASTFVAVQTYSDANGIWVEHTTPLGAIPAGIKNIAFKTPSGLTNYYYWVDDIYVDLATPTCPRPTAVTGSNTTHNSAKISWTENGTATAWVIEYRKIYETNWTAVSAPTNPCILTGLAPATDYKVRVKAVCAAGTNESFHSYAGSFTTECSDIAVLPYIQTFETNDFNFYCWKRYGTTPSNIQHYGYNYGSAVNNSPSGASYLRFYYTNNYTAVLPPFTMDVNTLKINFWSLRAGVNSGTLQVGYLTNIDNASSFVAVRTFDDTDKIWLEHEVVLTSVPAGVKNIAFKTPNGSSSWYYWVDDIFIDTATPICPRPTAVTANDITDTSAKIYWTAGSETAWVVEYKKASETNYTSVSTSNNPYTLQGLEPYTDYSVRVKALCVAGTNESYFSYACNFKTECSAISVFPYIESFNENSDLNCWLRYNGSSATTSSPSIYSANNSSSSNNSPSGSKYLYFSYSNSLTAILPLFAVDINTLQIEFWLNRKDNNSGTFSLGYYTDINNPNTFVEIERYNIANNIWLKISKMLNNVPNGIKNIALRQNQLSQTSYYWVDDIVVSELPTCLIPSINDVSAGVAVAGRSTARISVTEYGTATQWQYVISTSKTINPNDSTPALVSTNPFAIENLAPTTKYYIWLRSYCDETKQSPWHTDSLTTACAAILVNVANPFFEGFEPNSQTLHCWKIIDNNKDGRTWVVSTGSSVNLPHTGTQYMELYTLAGGSYDDYLISPALTITGNCVFDYWYRGHGSSYQEEFEVLLSTTGNNVADFTTTLVPMTIYNNTSYALQPAIDLSAYSGQTIYIAWHAVSPNGWLLYLDDVSIKQIVTNDLSVTNITSSVGESGFNLTSANFTVTVKNNGTVMQTNIPVKLEIDGVVLPNTQNISAIASLGTTTVTFSNVNISTLTTHTFNIRAFLELATDQHHGNDTISMSITNQIVNTCTNGIRIGYGTAMQYYVPVYSYYNYNYTQTIYLADDIRAAGGRTGGDINSIAFDYNNGTLTNANVWTVYMGQTTMSRFQYENSWVPFAHLQQVYNGAVWLPPSAGWLKIDFLTPFVWDGVSNIVVAVHENTPGAAPQGTYAIWNSTAAANTWDYRTMAYYSDNTNPNPASPPTSGCTGSHIYPNIKINICYGVAAVANFTYQKNDLTVTFTDTSTGNPTAWAWDFGDGTTSTSQNPVHIYDENGTYNVTLVVTNTRGESAPVTKQVTVAVAVVIPPTVVTDSVSAITQTTATLHKTVTAGTETVTAQGFKYKKTSESSWQTSTNGNLTNLTPNTQYQFYAYATTATDTYNGSTLIFTTLPTAVLPVADFTFETNDLSVTFTDASTGEPTIWVWNLGDGATSTYQNPVHTYAASGTYNVTLIVINAQGGSEPVTKQVSVAETGLDNLFADEIIIYPNPAKDELRIKSEELKIEGIEITNLAGCVVGATLAVAQMQNAQRPGGRFPAPTGTATINVSALPQGIYFVKIYTDKGVVMRKIMKK